VGIGSSSETGRRELAARLRRRLPQIEEAILERVNAIEAPPAAVDAAYVSGVRESVHEGIGYALRGMERAEGPPPIPAAAGLQARRSARRGISLELVLRRYHAGDRLLSEFIISEAGDLPPRTIAGVLRSLDPLVERLTAAVAVDYADEIRRVRRTSAQRLRDEVERLLGCDRDPEAGLDYDFDRRHLGMIFAGAGARGFVQRLAAELDGRALVVPIDDDVTWAWLGFGESPAPAAVAALLDDSLPSDLSVALGEPHRGIDGWRLTHLEARAALRVMVDRPQPVTRCRDVILLSAVMGDPVMRRSLVEAYLVPLQGRGDYSVELRRTLRAYFVADQNAVSTASALGVARHTVERRLRGVEERLGQTIGACSAQLQVALGVEDLLPGSRDEGPRWGDA
jgi:hypothetical protein